MRFLLCSGIFDNYHFPSALSARAASYASISFWSSSNAWDALSLENRPKPQRGGAFKCIGGFGQITLRLQEMFGVTTHPTVGRTPLRVTLLSPGQKPVQVTQDIVGFWESSYADVRRDMRGRYPRHPWPEDPADTPATALTKRALERRQSQR